MAYKKGKLLDEGKTKRIFQIISCTELVWIEYKNAATNKSRCFFISFTSSALYT